MRSTEDVHNRVVQPLLAVDRATKHYGDGTVAVDGISFQVARNEVVGLVGPNGAGKTTTISMVLGVLQPTRGRISIAGLDLADHREAALLRTNFSAVYASLPGNLTVFENLRVFGLIYGVPNLKSRIDALVTELDLRRFGDTKFGLLSSGEQTRVCLAKALLNRPKLLLLDEPTASLDPATARDMRSHIRRLLSDGDSGVLWTSHNMYEVEEVCTRVLFMSRGKILLDGDPRTLPAQHGMNSLEELFISVAREPVSLLEKKT